jgi:hypothetical protein
MSPVAYPGIFPLLTLSSTLYLYFSPNITAIIALLAYHLLYLLLCCPLDLGLSMLNAMLKELLSLVILLLLFCTILSYHFLGYA